MTIKFFADLDTRTVVRRLLLLLPIYVVVNLAIAFLFTDSSDLLRLQSFTLGYFLLAAGLRMVPWFTKAFRLANWMRFLGHPFTFRDGMRISMMSELGAAVSPTAIGGEPIKTGMLYRRGVSFGESASLTSVAAVEDLGFYIIGIPVAFWLTEAWKMPRVGRFIGQVFSNLQNILLLAGMMIALAALVVFVVRKTGLLQNFRARIRKFWQEFGRLYSSMIRRGKWRYLVNVLLAGIHWSARYSVVAALTVSLGYEADLLKFFLLQWLVFTLMSLVPTPGATGGAEGLFLLLFGGALPEQAIGTLLLGWRFLDFYFLTVLALIMLGIDQLLHQGEAGKSPLQKELDEPAVNRGPATVPASSPAAEDSTDKETKQE